MGLSNLSKIKSLFIVDEKSTETKKNTDTNKTIKENLKTSEQSNSKSNVSWKSSTSSNSDGTISNNTTGKYSPKIFDSLTKAISEANLPGEDYLEFMDGLKAMKDLPMEESLKLKSVFMTLTTKGLTIPKIVESASHYLSVLEKEKTKFYDAIASQKKNKVENKQKHINDLKAKNKEKADLIKKLTDEMSTNNKEIEKETIEIKDVETKIKTTENDFIYTFNKVSNKINENVEKIKKINS